MPKQAPNILGGKHFEHETVKNVDPGIKDGLYSVV